MFHLTEVLFLFLYHISSCDSSVMLAYTTAVFVANKVMVMGGKLMYKFYFSSISLRIKAN